MAVTSRSGATTPFSGVVFGCGHNNSGTFNANEMGLIGFGRGAISFVSQVYIYYHFQLLLIFLKTLFALNSETNR